MTSDGPWKESGFKAGCVEGALPTGNFGSDAAKQFPAMEQYIGKKVPLMCMEFWNGWFDAWVRSIIPLSMEEIDQSVGYMLYRIQTTPEEKVLNIQLEGANDRTQVYQNGVLSFVDGFDNRGCFYESKEPVTAPVIDLLCENMSRENFGTGLDEQRKGISKGVKINEHYHYGYEIYSLPFDEEQIAKLNFDKGYEEGQPSFSLYELEIDEVADTFLDFTGFGKGCAFVNGFNIGRFWEIGPQKRLYIPAPLLKKGLNQIILFETEGKTSDCLSLCDTGVF